MRIPVPHDNSMVPRRFRVTGKTQETDDIYTFTLVPVDEGSGFGFLPGQFNMLYLFGYGEVPVSISGDPACRDQLTHTVRVAGSVTNAFANLETGDMVGVRGPYGSSWPIESAEGENVLIVAGGLGLAPLRSAIYSLLAERGRFRKISILLGARSPETILFGEELKHWREGFDIGNR